MDGIPEHAPQGLYRYWVKRRGRGRVPSVRDMDPLDLPPNVLPWLFLFRHDEIGCFRCILVGTGIVGVDGRDTTGWLLDELPWTVDKARQIHLFEEAASTGLPIYYSGQWRTGPTTKRLFSRLLLPVGRDAQTVDHMFGMVHFDGANDRAPCRPAAPDDVDRLLAVRRATSSDFYLPHLHEPALQTHG